MGDHNVHASWQRSHSSSRMVVCHNVVDLELPYASRPTPRKAVIVYSNRTVRDMFSVLLRMVRRRLTGVRKDSATNRALAFSCLNVSIKRPHSRQVGTLNGGYRNGEHTKSFISDISLSTSSMNCMMKSTSLCFNISSVWKLVIRNEIS